MASFRKDPIGMGGLKPTLHLLTGSDIGIQLSRTGEPKTARKVMIREKEQIGESRKGK